MAEEIFIHRQVLAEGDIIDMKIFRVPKTATNPEGVSYSVAYIKEGKRLVGYDNNEGHGRDLFHHKHVKERIIAYAFIDEWKLIEDFMEDIEKIERGAIK